MIIFFCQKFVASPHKFFANCCLRFPHRAKAYMNTIYTQWLTHLKHGKKALAILIDPEKFVAENAFAKAYLSKIPHETTHILVGGSTDREKNTEEVVDAIRRHSSLPILLFPGDHQQLTPRADAVLFLSLLSGENPKYLIGEQLQAAPLLNKMDIEVIPTGYILVDGGVETSVSRISQTTPLSQEQPESIVHTALAGEYLGKKCIYLEGGSGALTPVKPEIIRAVKAKLGIPLIVGGGIRSRRQLQEAYTAGASMVVIGTAFEEEGWTD